MHRDLEDRSLDEAPIAAMGGAPVRKKWLPYGCHGLLEDDIQEVVNVLHSDWITQGPCVEKFERAVADSCGAPYGVAFSSGTAALHAACAATGLGPGDEAITTPLTFAATANAVLYCGAIPLFADIRADTLNIDPEDIERRLSPRTKAILPVDFAGQPADLDAILSLAKNHHLTVIEDACHALGGKYHGRPIGSVSHMTIFSFHPVKHLTTGEGGMVVTNQLSLAEKLKKMRHHGIDQGPTDKPWRYQISSLGYNYRLSDIHCALGLHQLGRLEKQLDRRQEIANAYREAFANLPLSLPASGKEVTHAWHLFIILLELQKLSVDRDEVLRALRAENIGATWHYPPVHLQPLYREKLGFKEGTCPHAEALTERMITLPLFPAMTDGDVQDVVTAVQKVLHYYTI